MTELFFQLSRRGVKNQDLTAFSASLCLCVWCSFCPLRFQRIFLHFFIQCFAVNFQPPGCLLFMPVTLFYTEHRHILRFLCNPSPTLPEGEGASPLLRRGRGRFPKTQIMPVLSITAVSLRRRRWFCADPPAWSLSGWWYAPAQAAVRAAARRGFHVRLIDRSVPADQEDENQNSDSMQSS